MSPWTQPQHFIAILCSVSLWKYLISYLCLSSHIINILRVTKSGWWRLHPGIHSWHPSKGTPLKVKAQSTKSDKTVQSEPSWIKCNTAFICITALLIIADFILCAQHTAHLCRLLIVVAAGVVSKTAQWFLCKAVWSQAQAESCE